MGSFKNFQRAIVLLSNSGVEEDLAIIKLLPEPKTCCCFHCWPETWNKINNHIAPQGPIKDEGDILIVHQGKEIVLECHESGPEIAFYFKTAIDSIPLIKSIVDLLTTFIKAMKEDRKAPARIKLQYSYIRKGKIEEKILAELDLPLKDDITKMLNSQIQKALQSSFNDRI
jgi:hypothetical protein